MPEFRPEEWHGCASAGWLECTSGANCYTYALDEPAYGWSAPGLGYVRARAALSFEEFRWHTLGKDYLSLCGMMAAGALHDGLQKAPEPVKRTGYYLTALLFTPESDRLFDFHWLRQDENGLWSHKNGLRAPTKVDDAGNPITDPAAAVLESHPVLGGYFYVPLGGVVLREMSLAVPDAEWCSGDCDGLAVQ